jgi:hypothetical protein
MQDTSFRTVAVPNAVAGAQPTVVARATDVPCRVLVENATGTLIFLARASQDIVGPSGPTGGTFRVRPNTSHVFVLAPEQELFAAGNGAGAQLSVSMSEALPLV